MNKKILLSYILLFASIITSAQENDVWYSFEDNKTQLIGFKDSNANVKIAPKFGLFTRANKFDKIIAVAEPKSNRFESYYLTKTGKKVGVGSMHIYDNGVDCESEGFIRFRDHKTGKVGLFDGDGNVVIPPIYNDVLSVHNKMLFALQGASMRRDGEHSFFAGGVETLIDTKNNTLIKNFSLDENINLYSIATEDKKHLVSPIRDYFEGEDGTRYSFINYEKEFHYWFESVLKKELESEKIEKHFFDKVSYWDDNFGWILVQKKDLKPELVNNIRIKLKRANSKDEEYQIFLEDLNKFIYESKEFEPFFDNCNDAIKAKYPVMTVVIMGKNKGKEVQDHFEFLRTDDEYKLIGLSIKSE